MARTITSANAVLMLGVAGLFSTPQQIQGFGPDDAFDSEAIEAAEVQFGVDGVLSAGLIYEAVPQTITLAASSRSIDFFEQWRSSELAQQEKLFAFGTLLLPSTGAKYAMSGGVLMRYPAMPRGQKVLQPRQFGLVWESVTPAPV